MNKICYVAIPRDWESPKGVVMRTSLHNGYGNVAAMCASLEIPCNGDGLDLLSEQSLLFTTLATATPQIAYSLLANSYSVDNKDAASWIIDELRFHRSQFTHHFSYCQECLQDELISVFQDLTSLPTCPFHQTMMITSCPDCHQSEHWTTAHILFCKCGFDRRNTPGQRGMLFHGEYVETFGPSAGINALSNMVGVALTAEAVWHSRKPSTEKRSCCFMDEVLNHAKKMMTTQLSRYPGFMRSQHLSAWHSSHPTLAKLAEDTFKEPNKINKNCIAGICCADVEFTVDQLIYSLGDWKNWTEEKQFISKNFNIHRHGTAIHYYRCHIPICRLARGVKDRDLHLKTTEKALESNYVSTLDAAALLQCSSGEVLQLVELGYLQKLKKNKKKSGCGYPTLISRRSIHNFNYSFILVGKIAKSLNTTPVKAVRLLNQSGIASDHNKLGPYVYEQHKIYFIQEELEKALASPSLLYPIALPPTRRVYNTFNIHNSNLDQVETPPSAQPDLLEGSAAEKKVCCFTTHQAATFLNITGRLLHYRFVLTGLIIPEIIDDAPYYSLIHIQSMSHHLQHHISLEQATEVLNCGRKKISHLINTFELKSSCTLVYSNGDRQLLYDKDDINQLKNLQKTKKTKTTLR